MAENDKKVPLTETEVQVTEVAATRSRGLSHKAMDFVRRWTHGKEEQKEFEKWPVSHPYAYTIGDVVQAEAPDVKSGKVTQLWFAHPDVAHNNAKKRKVRKVFISFKIKRVSDIDNVAEKVIYRFIQYTIY